MQHNTAFHRVYTVCKSKRTFWQKNTILFFKIITYNFVLQNYNLTPLDIYNGLYYDNCIKQEGRIHKYTMGLMTPLFTCIYMIIYLIRRGITLLAIV